MARTRAPVARRVKKKPAPRAAAVAAGPGQPHVVYVHGICPHDAGYSDPWWAAVKPFLPDVPDANRHEVIWSDVIAPAAAALAARADRLTVARELLRPSPERRPPPVVEQIEDVLADRAQRQLVAASLEPAGAVAFA